MPLLFLGAPTDVLGRIEQDLGPESIQRFDRSEAPQWRQKAIEAAAENNSDGTAKPVPTVQELTETADAALERSDTLVSIVVENDVALDALAKRIQAELNPVN